MVRAFALEDKFEIEPLKLPSIKSITHTDWGVILLSHEGQVWVYGEQFDDLGSNLQEYLIIFGNLFNLLITRYH